MTEPTLLIWVLVTVLLVLMGTIGYLLLGLREALGRPLHE
jgi:hypothetical protein